MSSSGIQGNSSFWRRNGSNGDKQPALSGSGWGRPVSSIRPATGGGESERPPSSFKPPAAGGGGWGRPPGPPSSSAAGGGRWGPPSSFKPQPSGGGAARPSPPPNFGIVLIAALLLLPGVTQPIADDFTQDYIQRNHILDPHTQDDIERAIAAFHLQHQQKPPAPPEGYTAEYVGHCFHEKYELPKNLREEFEGFVQSYLVKNPKPFTMKLQTAVDRALLKIHESLSEENGGQIPEKDSRPPPPAPAPAPLPLQRPPQPGTRNSNNLFGQLLRLGRSHRISEQNLIDYLRSWTSLQEIRDIAEQPTSADVEYGLKEMLKAISPGAVMFRDVCEHGLSPETIGQKTFYELMLMKRGPKIGQVWGIQICPEPYEIMRAFSFKEGVAYYRYLSAFIKGVYIEPNGEVVHFTCPDFKTSGSRNLRMVGNPAIFWTSDVGTVIYTKEEGQFDRGQHDYTLGVGRSGAGYSGERISYDHHGAPCTFGKLKGDALHAEMTVDKRAFFARKYVTAEERENLDVGKNHEVEDQIRGNPEYQAACNEAMAKIGGIPVSLCSTAGQQEPEEQDHHGAAAPDDSVMIFCYHGNRVKSFDKYTLCPDCKSHPGKQPIMDGWGTGVVGYRQKP